MGNKSTEEEKLGKACRIRQIRENLHLTQEAMAEILEISVDAYGKIENGINGLSYNVLKNYRKKLGVSADFILFGTYQSSEGAWDLILNCAEKEKMELLLRLIEYFTCQKKQVYPVKEDTGITVDKIMAAMEQLK